MVYRKNLHKLRKERRFAVFESDIRMSKYNGSKCIVCGEVFCEDDDVVVCAECGTPYHPECYTKEGKCINIPLHETNGSWYAEALGGNEEIKNDGDMKICPRCGSKNTNDEAFCVRCGFSLASVDGKLSDDAEYHEMLLNDYGFNVNYGDPLCGLNPEEDFEGAKVSEIAEFVGVSTQYYLPIFKFFKIKKKKISWNLTALILPQVYFLYRKMYAWGILAIILSFIINIPSAISMIVAYPEYFGELAVYFEGVDLRSASFTSMYNVCSIAHYVFMFFRTLFANWLYYRHVINSVNDIKEKSAHPSEARERFKIRGGVSIRSIIILICLTFALAAILTVIAL